MPVFASISFSDVLPYLIGLVVILVAVFFVLRFLRSLFSRRHYARHHVFSIRIPKERPDDNNGHSVQSIKEEIAKGEAIFAGIGGLRAQRGFSAWLNGRSDHVSFEIVASAKQIAFYFAAQREAVRYLEQHIHAHYPEAVIEEIEDYNSFGAVGQTSAAYLKTVKSFVFPLKTYQEMEVDPMNSLISVLSKLEKGESLAIQYLVLKALGMARLDRSLNGYSKKTLLPRELVRDF